MSGIEAARNEEGPRNCARCGKAAPNGVQFTDDEGNKRVACNNMCKVKFMEYGPRVSIIIDS